MNQHCRGLGILWALQHFSTDFPDKSTSWSKKDILTIEIIQITKFDKLRANVHWEEHAVKCLCFADCGFTRHKFYKTSNKRRSAQIYPMNKDLLEFDNCLA